MIKWQHIDLSTIDPPLITFFDDPFLTNEREIDYLPMDGMTLKKNMELEQTLSQAFLLYQFFAN